MEATQQRRQRKARARLQMARDRIASADYTAAMNLLHSALRQLEREPGSHIERAQCYVEMARCQNQQGLHSSALTYALWARNLLRDEWNADLTLAEAELQIGTALVRVGGTPEAHRYLARAYKVFAERGLWALAAACLENMGVLARQNDQIVRAINAFHVAKQLYRQAEDVAGVQRTRSYLRELIPKE